MLSVKRILNVSRKLIEWLSAVTPLLFALIVTIYCLPLIMCLTKTSHGGSAHSLQRLRHLRVDHALHLYSEI